MFSVLAALGILMVWIIVVSFVFYAFREILHKRYNVSTQ